MIWDTGSPLPDCGAAEYWAHRCSPASRWPEPRAGVYSPGPKLRNLSPGNVTEAITGANFGGIPALHEAESYLDHLSGGREVIETDLGKYFAAPTSRASFAGAEELFLRSFLTLLAV
jgi:hypothetical protein